MRSILMSMPLLALVACGPSVPDSGAGVGFDALGRSERDIQLQTGVAPQPTTVLPPERLGGARPAQVELLPAPGFDVATGPGAEIAAATAQALADTALDQPAPVLNADNPGISSEQDFSVVSAERGIEADAARIEAARQQFQLVQPQELERVDDTGPNIIQYALGASHSVRERVYNRSPFSNRARFESRCAGYRTADVAQEQFLAAGGPQRDRLGLDPDGDGFACAWDPATFRNLVRN